MYECPRCHKNSLAHDLYSDNIVHVFDFKCTNKDCGGLFKGVTKFNDEFSRVTIKAIDRETGIAYEIEERPISWVQ